MNEVDIGTSHGHTWLILSWRWAIYLATRRDRQMDPLHFMGWRENMSAQLSCPRTLREIAHYLWSAVSEGNHILPLIRDFLLWFQDACDLQVMHALKLQKEAFNQLQSVTVNYVIPIGQVELCNRISVYKIKLSIDCWMNDASSI